MIGHNTLTDLRMPAPFDRYHHSEDFAEDRQALRGWCSRIGSKVTARRATDGPSLGRRPSTGPPSRIS